MGVPWCSRHPLWGVARGPEPPAALNVSYIPSLLRRNLSPGWGRGLVQPRFCSWTFIDLPACSWSSSQLILSPSSPASLGLQLEFMHPQDPGCCASAILTSQQCERVCAHTHTHTHTTPRKEVQKSCSGKCLNFHFQLQLPARPLFSSSFSHVTS